MDPLSEETFRVVMDERELACEHPKRQRESIGWSAIEEIFFLTTDQGPFLPDVWLIFAGKSESCAVPQGAFGYDALYENIQKWPGFDFEAVIAAMGSTENNTFVCWKKGNQKLRN